MAASARRAAGVRGELDHFAALGFLQGLLTVLRDCGHPGLLLVLDEIETLQRVRGDVREKGLNALRQLVDELDTGRFPGLFLVITGTPAFFDGQQGVQRLPPLAQRLATDLATDPRFDSRARCSCACPGSTWTGSVSWVAPCATCTRRQARHPDRVAATVDDAYIDRAGPRGHRGAGRPGRDRPRGCSCASSSQDVLDRVDEYADFDPRRHYALTLIDAELTEVERNARGAGTGRRCRAGPVIDRLHPALAHHVVNTPGLAVAAAVAGGGDRATARWARRRLLLAPTAGGKTEAAVFPLLTAMERERLDGRVGALHVPAEGAAEQPAPRAWRRTPAWLGRGRRGLARGRRRVRRGSASCASARRPAHHPESLEAMLVSTKVEHRQFLGDLRAVVVDEVHAFAGDDRGWHLLAVLERLTRLGGRPLQRVGLSATVGNPAELLTWLQGVGRGRPASVVAPAAAASGDVDIELDHVGTVDNAARFSPPCTAARSGWCSATAARWSRSSARRCGTAGVTTFLSHASLSLDERRRAETAFAEARDCVIVSTSTLELGIDVGDLDRVVQIDAPSVGGVVPAAPRSHRAPSRNGAELPVPGPRRAFPAVGGGAAPAVGHGLRRAGRRATRTAPHRGAADPRPVPAGSHGRTEHVARGVERPRALRPQRRADRALTSWTRASSSRTAACSSSVRRPRSGSGTGTSPG